jgi:manganese transport protein
MTLPNRSTSEPPEAPATRQNPIAGGIPGWRRTREAPSLAEVYRSVPVSRGNWFRKLLSFGGPGYLVAVGYMDPGNWATDLAGGAQFGYTLLYVILLSNLMAVLLQGLASKLGIVTGRDLAQACRDAYPKRMAFSLWVIAELAIAACDLAEVIGTAIALQLLFGLSLPVGVVLTALDVLVVLWLQGKGFRLLEAMVIALVAVVGVCFLFELFLSQPNVPAVLRGFIPGTEIAGNRDMLYIAIGILGATVMPHNLYLHSSIVQTRKYEETSEGKREAVRYAFADSTIALTFALCINAAILIVAGATFHSSGNSGVAEIQDAWKLLTPLRGQYRVCTRAAGVGTELDTDGHARRSDCDGRFSQSAASTVGPPTHYAFDCDCPGSRGQYLVRRPRHVTAPRPQSGDTQPAVVLRRVSAGRVHLGSPQDGRVRECAVAHRACMDHRSGHCCTQCVAVVSGHW